jgi:AcrR family transcriptional regulator
MASKIRGRIVDAAVELYAQHGLHGTTTIQIAKRADVTEGSLFRLFHSKDRLFEEALQQVAANLLKPAKLQEALANEDFAAAISGASQALISKYSDNAMRFVTFARLECPDLADKYTKPFVRHCIRALAARIALAKGQTRRGLDPDEAALDLWCLLTQTKFQSVAEGASKKRQAVLVEKRLKSWLGGVLKS